MKPGDFVGKFSGDLLIFVLLFTLIWPLSNPYFGTESHSEVLYPLTPLEYLSFVILLIIASVFAYLYGVYRHGPALDHK